MMPPVQRSGRALRRIATRKIASAPGRVGFYGGRVSEPLGHGRGGGERSAPARRPPRYADPAPKFFEAAVLRRAGLGAPAIAARAAAAAAVGGPPRALEQRLDELAGVAGRDPRDL